jgi:GAF domain-containing protein
LVAWSQTFPSFVMHPTPEAGPSAGHPRPTGHEPETLAGALLSLAEARDLDRVTLVVRYAARRLTGADGATFVLREGAHCHYADEDAISPLWKGQRFPAEKCVSGWVMEHDAPVMIEDIYADPRVLQEAYRPTFVKSLALAPIRRGQPVGAIGIYWATPHRATMTEMQILQSLADETAKALQALGR